MRVQQLDPTHDDDLDEWYPPGAACAVLAGHALAFTDHLHAALADYAAVITAALAARGLPAGCVLAAGCDLAGIELTVPALARMVSDGCVRFTDDAGWHYLPSGGTTWARLVPLSPGLSAAQLAPAPSVVAAAIAGLARGGTWAHPAPGEPGAVDALAGPWLDALLDALHAHHQPPSPGGGRLPHAA